MATTYLKRVCASNGSNTTGTLSAWLKREAIGSAQCAAIAGQEGTNDNQRLFFGFWSDDTLALQIKDGALSPALYEQSSAAKFRDPAAWYHIVARLDTSNGTAQDRVQLWVNGEKITTYTTNNTFPSSIDIKMFESSTSCETLVGARKNGTTYENISGGSMSHVHVVDGTAYDASTFGETDSTSGIWKLKTDPTVTYGTNGFWLKMEDRTNLDLDSGTNAFTNFTTAGTLTPTTDNPSNNFATFNPNMIGTGASVSNGNCSFASGSSINNALVAPTLAASKGKWYWEAQVSHACAAFGISDTEKLAEEKRNNQANGISSGNQSISWEGNGYMKYSNTQVAYGDAMADATLGGTTLGFFADLDNNKLYLAEDGVIQNSGTGYTITAPASTDSGYYYLGVCGDQCSATSNVQGYVNFGNGVFHTTLLTGTTYSDAGGIGVFKYSPNQGGAANFDSAAKDFYAVCTKNIKAYG